MSDELIVLIAVVMRVLIAYEVGMLIYIRNLAAMLV